MIAFICSVFPSRWIIQETTHISDHLASGTEDQVGVADALRSLVKFEIVETDKSRMWCARWFMIYTKMKCQGSIVLHPHLHNYNEQDTECTGNSVITFLPHARPRTSDVGQDGTRRNTSRGRLEDGEGPGRNFQEFYLPKRAARVERYRYAPQD